MTSNATDSCRVCVIVPTYNRAPLLPGLIEALKVQTLTDFEVLVVDDGSTDNTYAELGRLADGDDRIRVLQGAGNAGAATARNLAWRSTAAPLVAFTDDDCVPSPKWLDELVAAAEGVDIVQGRTAFAEPPASEGPGWFDRSQHIPRWSGRFETCNLAISRKILECHGGFDERLVVMGEDTDLGLRAVAAGASTTFAPDAIVVHHRWRQGFRGYLRERHRYAESVKLMKLNPDARGLLRGRYVLRGVHLLQWALIPAVPLSIWLGAPWFVPGLVVAWAAVNTYRTRYRQSFSTGKRFAYSLLHFVGYGYEAVCYAIASVRYRALVI